MLVDVRGGDETNFAKYKTSGVVSEDTLTELLDKWIAGELAPYQVSESLPSEEKNSGPIKKIVGRNFESEVVESDRDVMVLFEASWCSHCREFEESYAAL